MTLTISDVEHVALLARLGLTDDEKTRLRDQLSSILGHIDVLNQLDTDIISPTAQVLPLINVTRKDLDRPSFPVVIALANAPRHVDGFFEVHAVLSGDDNSGSMEGGA